MITAEDQAKAFGYLTINEVRALKKLANMLPDNSIVVNIGAGAGTSGLAFMESREDLILYTVDKQLNDSPLGCLNAEAKLVRDAGFESDRHSQVWGNSYDIGISWYNVDLVDLSGNHISCVDIDLVFIDADHLYESCKNDILAWLPNIKAGGIIALHDYKKHEVNLQNVSAKPWPGVDQAVDELLLGKYEQILRVDSLVAFRV